jgi:CBS domain-containing protein
MDTELHTTEPASAYGHAPLITIDGDATLRQAAQLLHDHDIGAVAVVEGTQLVGVLSERDLARALARGAASDTDTVASWMSGAPITARPDDPVLDVALQMLEEGVRHLPLVDAYGKPHGMISLRDIQRPLLLQAMTPPPKVGDR